MDDKEQELALQESWMCKAKRFSWSIHNVGWRAVIEPEQSKNQFFLEDQEVA